MRLLLAGLSTLALSACVYDVDHAPGAPGTPGGQMPRAERLPPPQGPVGSYDKNSPPDTAYEIRRAEIDRDNHIAGKDANTYPPLFKDQKDSKENGG